jgi:hypothetical protein
MTRWQKFAGTLASLVLAGGIVLSATAPSLAGMTTAKAQRPVAVVEEVKGKVVGVEFMDYVTPGTVIKLGPKGSIVLGYMKSCWRETITGGTVVVGVEQSLVHLAEIERVKVDCGASQPLIDQRTRESAGTVFRGVSSLSN